MILQENIFYLNGKVINLKEEGKYAGNKEKNIQATAANFLGKILPFSKNLFVACLFNTVDSREQGLKQKACSFFIN